MREKSNAGLVIALGVIAVFVLYVGYYHFLYSGYALIDGGSELKGVRSGSFGDAFGTLNALFSGLAFPGVLITLYYQRKDLEKSQAQNIRQQAESQFYNMLSLQQQVVQGFDLHRKGNSPHTIQGRDCFRDWQSKMIIRYSDLYLEFRGRPDIVRGLEAFDKVFKNNQGDLGLYFRSLYSVFKFIDGVDCAQRKHLGAVARSLLSDYELVFIFYNCLTPKGRKFNRFANEYKLFDNLDVELLLKKEHVVHADKLSLGSNEAALTIRGAVDHSGPS